MTGSVDDRTTGAKLSKILQVRESVLSCNHNMSLYQHPVEFLTDRDDDSDYFRTIHGRALNTLNDRYMLPVDHDEVKVPLVAYHLLPIHVLIVDHSAQSSITA